MQRTRANRVAFNQKTLLVIEIYMFSTSLSTHKAKYIVSIAVANGLCSLITH